MRFPFLISAAIPALVVPASVALSACSSSGSGSGADAGSSSDSGLDGSVAEGGNAGEAAATDSGAMDANGGPQCQDGGAAVTPGASGQTVTVSAGASCALPAAITSDTDLSPAKCAVYGAPEGLIVGNPEAGPAPTLTIEAGTTIAFGSGTNLIVGGQTTAWPTSGPGALVVNGTLCQPVVFTAETPDSGTLTPGLWGGVTFQPATATSTVKNLVVQYGGGPSAYLNNMNGPPGTEGSFRLDGVGFVNPADFTVVLDGVTVSNNATNGFVFFGTHTGPGPGSGTLTVTDWPSPLYSFDPYLINPDAVGLLASTTLSTPKGGYVHVAGCSSDKGCNYGDVIDSSETWPSIPIPYVLGLTNEKADDYILDVVATTPTDGGVAGTTWTIAAPNTLQFDNGFRIDVGVLDGPTDAHGYVLAAIQANGQPSAPITFEGLGGVAKPGSWAGINFPNGAGAVTPTSITNATIDSAGTVVGWDSPAPIGVGAFVQMGGCCSCGTMPAATIDHVVFSNLPASYTDPSSQKTTTPYSIVAPYLAPSATTTYAADNTFPSAATGVDLSPLCP